MSNISTAMHQYVATCPYINEVYVCMSVCMYACRYIVILYNRLIDYI